MATLTAVVTVPLLDFVVGVDEHGDITREALANLPALVERHLTGSDVKFAASDIVVLEPERSWIRVRVAGRFETVRHEGTQF